MILHYRGEEGARRENSHTSLSLSLSEDNSDVSEETKLWFSSEEEIVDEMVGTEVGDSRATSLSLMSCGDWTCSVLSLCELLTLSLQLSR